MRNRPEKLPEVSLFDLYIKLELIQMHFIFCDNIAYSFTN